MSPRSLARRLAREDCHEALLEGGSTLGTAWLRSGLVDRLAVFTAPRLLGSEGLDWCGPLAGARLGRSPEGRIETCERVGADALLVVRLGR